MNAQAFGGRQGDLTYVYICQALLRQMTDMRDGAMPQMAWAETRSSSLCELCQSFMFFPQSFPRNSSCAWSTRFMVRSLASRGQENLHSTCSLWSSPCLARQKPGKRPARLPCVGPRNQEQYNPTNEIVAGKKDEPSTHVLRSSLG
jgi:hypothetical protein